MAGVGGFLLEGREQRVQKRTEELELAKQELQRRVFETQEALEALRVSEQRLKLHIMQTPLAVIDWDPTFRVAAWNRAAEQMFGYTAQEAVGRLASELIIPQDTRHQVQGIWSELLHGTGGTRSTNKNLRKDGTILLCEWYNTALVDQEGQVIGVSSLVQDVTESKRLEAQLRQSQKMEAIGTLAGGIAHDFNNLLMIISGYADIAMERDKGQEVTAPLSQIKNATDRAASLTRQLLAFSRKQVLEPVVLDLNGVVTNIERLLVRLIGENIHLETVLGKNLPTVKVDPGQMEQVIMNLAVNARDAMPNGGRLTLETSDVTLDEDYAREHVSAIPGRYVMLAISDTGYGMSRETQERIFEPFFTTKEHGTGLGLATVYGIVKQSGGWIWVYSEIGSGTTFKIHLPATEAAAQQRRQQVATSCAKRGETVLVVEDSLPLRSILSEYLSRGGFHVVEAGDGLEALKLVEGGEGTIHLLLTDVVMPGMSGRELADELTSRVPTLKVLFMSGYTDDAIVHHGIIEPGVALISKPFTREQLFARLEQVLGEHSSQ
jgi:PAS domain S-box-containing protein